MLNRESEKLFNDIQTSKEFIQNQIRLKQDIVASYETGGVPNHLSAEIARIENSRLNDVLNTLILCEKNLNVFLRPAPA